MSKNPVAKLETITPEKALELLVENNMNRSVTYRLVERIAEEITAGRWQVNGDAIRIAEDGTILDGQHRLMAIEKSGIAVETFIVYNLKKECFSTINTNCRSRSSSDVLSIAKETNCTTLATALNWVCRYSDESLISKKHYSIADQQETLVKHPEIRKSVGLAMQVKNRLLPSAPTAFLHYMFHQKDAELADIFINGISGGYDVKYSNFRLFNEKLIRNFTAKVKIDRNEIVILGVKAWNATRQNLSLKVLRFDSNEAAPKIK